MARRRHRRRISVIKRREKFGIEAALKVRYNRCCTVFGCDVFVLFGDRYRDGLGLMRMRRLGIWGLGIAVFLYAGEGFGQSSDGAFSALMNEGIRQFKQGEKDPSQYAAAIQTFRRAYEIEPNVDILYNIGRCYHLMNDCSKALDMYRQYAATSVDNALDVKDYIAELNSQCGVQKAKLTLTCVPSDATLMIDGTVEGTCSGVHEIAFGAHKLSFLAEGYEAQTREVEVDAKRSSLKLMVVMNASSGNGVALAPEEGRKSEEEGEGLKDGEELPYLGQTPLFWGAVGSGVGGVVFSIVGAALLATSYGEGSYNGKSVEGLYRRHSGRFIGGSVLVGIGISAVAAGVGLFIADAFMSRSSCESSSEDGQVAITPSLGLASEGASAWVTMTF